MTRDDSVADFARALADRNVTLDGAVLMPPQDPPTNDPLPSSQKWRDVLQNSFVGPLSLLKAAIATMKPDHVQPAGAQRTPDEVAAAVEGLLSSMRAAVFDERPHNRRQRVARSWVHAGPLDG
jgi:hypothetical protein